MKKIVISAVKNIKKLFKVKIRVYPLFSNMLLKSSSPVKKLEPK